MITRAEELQPILHIKNITLDDETLNGLIRYYTGRITGLTGLNFDVQTYHYSIENKRYVDKIVLPLYNIFDVDEVHVNWELIDNSKYYTDTKNGVIFFKPPLTHADHIHVKYLTKIDDDLINNVIIPLLVDMIIDDQDPSTINGINGEITSIHEGNTSISMKNSTSLKDSIQNRLDKLAKGEILGIGNNRKGVMYI